MKHKLDNDKLFLRLEKGENILDYLYKIIKMYDIKSGWISGIGAIENVQIGTYDLSNKKYNKIDMAGVYELTSLSGNISIKEGEPFLHIHINISDHDGRAYGGHLFSAEINATGEFMIQILNIEISRGYDDDIGLHLWDFNDCG